MHRSWHPIGPIAELHRFDQTPVLLQKLQQLLLPDLNIQGVVGTGKQTQLQLTRTQLQGQKLEQGHPPIRPQQNMGPRGQTKGEKRSAFGIGSDQGVGHLRNQVAIVPNRALLTVQRRGVSNSDVIVVKGVVVRHFPIALQAEAAAGLLLQGRLPLLASLLMDQLQLLG